jgi:hypothetical protein
MTYLRTSKPTASPLLDRVTSAADPNPACSNVTSIFLDLDRISLSRVFKSFVDLHHRRRQNFSTQVFSQIASGLAQEISSCAPKFFLFPKMRGSLRILRWSRRGLAPASGNPRPTRHFGASISRNNFCTSSVAVIHSPLDRRISSRFEFVLHEKIFRELFHTTKYFVLVCRLFTF